MARSYCVNLYIAEDALLRGNHVFNFPKLSHREIRSLNRQVCETEIKKALFQMALLKALGPDGLPPIFPNRIGG